MPVFAQWTDGGVHKDKAGPGALLEALAGVTRDDVACVRGSRARSRASARVARSRKGGDETTRAVTRGPPLSLRARASGT